VPRHTAADGGARVVSAALSNLDVAIDQDVLAAGVLADLDRGWGHEQHLGDRTRVLLPWAAALASRDDPTEDLPLLVRGSGDDPVMFGVAADARFVSAVLSDSAVKPGDTWTKNYDVPSFLRPIESSRRW
jgi:hypothetical protein